MEGVIAVSIPIFVILGCVFLAWYGLHGRQRRREMLHLERMRALELGLPLPPIPAEHPDGDPYGNLKAAIILLFLGVAFAGGAFVSNEPEMLIPASICGWLGIGLFIIHRLVPKAADLQRGQPEYEGDPLADSSSPITRLPVQSAPPEA